MDVRKQLRIGIVALLAMGALATGISPSVGAAPPTTTTVQLLAINDFHGNLLPPAGSAGRLGPAGTPEYGGAGYLATHIKNLQATNPKNTFVVSAGDLIGASPLLSALYHDEPTVEAMNSIGLDLNAVGNHEFDEGATELQRMAAGGCHPVDGCLDGDDFAGADFDFLAANVVSRRTGKPLFAPYKVQRFGKVKVGFIGMTLEGTPSIVTPGGIAKLQFLDEADTANYYARILKSQGVESIVVLLHEGGVPADGFAPNGCGVTGAINNIVNRLDDEIDMMVSGHTHQPYNCLLPNSVARPIPVTSASSFGRLVTDIDLVVDNVTQDVTTITKNNVLVTRDVAIDAPVQAIITKYDVLSAPLRNRVIGSITETISTTAVNGQSAAGLLIADAQLAATDDAATGNAVMAFMNPGGVRAPFNFDVPAGTLGSITYEEMFTVQPFGNNLTTITLTGAQIYEMLKQQWCRQIAGSLPAVLQPSAGFTYTFSNAADPCVGSGKVVAGSAALNGTPIDTGASYRVTVNSFLADGGDQFPVLPQGTDRLGGAVDTDALEAYFVANSPLSPPALNRITAVP